MSCTCKTKQSTSSQYLKILEKKFDKVDIEKKEQYQLLTLKDKANKNNYEWIVWLQVKIAYANTNSCNHSSDENKE